MWDGFCVRSRKASESVPVGTVRMTDTEMAQKTPTDVHGVGVNQYKKTGTGGDQLSMMRSCLPFLFGVDRHTWNCLLHRFILPQ